MDIIALVAFGYMLSVGIILYLYDAFVGNYKW